MQAYRCFLLDDEGRPANLMEPDCTDEQAEQRCREILNDKQHPQVELWRGSTFLRRWNARGGR